MDKANGFMDLQSVRKALEGVYPDLLKRQSSSSETIYQGVYQAIEEIQTLRAQVETLQQRASEAESSRVRAEEIGSAFQTKLDSLKAELKTAQEAQGELLEENERLHVRLSLAEEREGDGLNAAVAEVGKRLEEEAVKRKTAQDKLARALMDLDAATDAAHNTALEASSLKQERTQLENVIAHQTADITALNKRLSDAEAEIKRLTNHTPTPQRISLDRPDLRSYSPTSQPLQAPPSPSSSFGDASEISRLKEEVRQVSEKLAKSSRTLERLKLDLIDKDQQLEQYVAEAQDKDDHLRDLEKQLDVIRMKEGATNTIASQSINQLKSEVERLRGCLNEKEIESQRNAKAAENLQRVLDEFQADYEISVKGEMVRLKEMVALTEKENAELKSRCRTVSQSLDQLQDQLSTLQAEAEARSKEANSSRNEALSFRRALEESMQRLNSLVQSEANLVDKRLVSKLFVTYFERDSRTRQDVLALMAKILQFSDDEKVRVGLMNPTWWTGSPGKGQPSGQESLTEMWVDFLLRESDQGDGPGGPS
mmetsp:Transcript_29466/g.47575  ORF Transcript_29466/g.47575 Transcript_29466/m.47575 type:complete len:539 (-) Transcript_29466:128-1744(-)|eukprot:CAMPEP_0184669834 /NCGR_PEP_ID=MMETSP0308-20130426/79298_1 /TAXON_ID=38269 /ORGANISM="Gloeochaete witrockiana, Strain SAG 46.84" /LENGTH=538 /DNA_ID=CAMNT_0027116291 /DNA_START=199 /DNA_END=1815 /DNA_ORIENTATION=+